MRNRKCWIHFNTLEFYFIKYFCCESTDFIDSFYVMKVSNENCLFLFSFNMKKLLFRWICVRNNVVRFLNPILFDVNTRPTWFVDDYCSKTRNKWSSGPKNSLFWKAFSDGVTIFEEKKSSKWFFADSKKFLWWINFQKSLWRSRIQINFKKNKLSKNQADCLKVKNIASWHVKKIFKKV